MQGPALVVDGVTKFPDSPEEMAEYALELREAARLVPISLGDAAGPPRTTSVLWRALEGLAPVKRKPDG
jgi:hypothetical protein